MLCTVRPFKTMALPYIGATISLTSVSDIRYEGTLYTLDPEKATVALQNVKCFGTEDRQKEITPASDEIFEFIIFRSSDIKSLRVFESPKPSIDTKAPTKILKKKQSIDTLAEKTEKLSLRHPNNSKPSIQPQTQTNYAAPPPFYGYDSYPTPPPQQYYGHPQTMQAHSQMYFGPPPTPIQSQQEYYDMPYGYSPYPYYHQGMNPYMGHGGLPGVSDYDFAGATARFRKSYEEFYGFSPEHIEPQSSAVIVKEEKVPEASVDEDEFVANVPVISKIYDKSKSFFDDISSSKEDRPNYFKEQYKLNTETFGDDHVRNVSKQRNRRGDRGRKGRNHKQRPFYGDRGADQFTPKAD